MLLVERKEESERKSVKGFGQTNFPRFILTFAITKTQNGDEITNVGSGAPLPGAPYDS
jgi:hypothetical protein